MKTKLVDCIVNHIFDNFGLTLESKTSLNSDSFLLNQTLTYVNGSEEQKCKLWGTELNVGDSKFRILCTDFSYALNNEDMEFAAIIQLENCPTYGCHLSIDTQTGDPYDGIILFALENNKWMMSNTYIQATFLAGIENLRDVFAECQTLSNYDDLIDQMKSFMEYVFLTEKV